MAPPRIAALVRLSGHDRGRTTRFSSDLLTIGTGPDADVRVSARALSSETAAVATDGLLAEIVRDGEHYVLRARQGAEVLVNGAPADARRLRHGDVIALGGEAELLRFRLFGPGSRAYKSLGEAWNDSVDCARHGGEGWLDSSALFLRSSAREMLTETAPWFRGAVLVLALTAVGVSLALWARASRLEAELSAASERMTVLSELVERGRAESFDAEEVEALRERLESRVSEADARLRRLEEREGARARIIAEASSSVLFLQGAFGFVEESSGRPLRFRVPPGGGPPRGVTLEGDGPPVEMQYTGTAFLVSERGLLITNRHVALPWEGDGSAARARDEGFVPAMRRLIAYAPSIPEPFPVRLVEASGSADVALLEADVLPEGLRPLELAGSAPSIGDDVVVLGYPTGIQALLARAAPRLIERVEQEAPTDFWKAARMLAGEGGIAPLATAGVVGQVGAGSIVYDAETTHGGSGGPVLSMEGRVVAVNAAILPQFGGSNLGVPVGHVRALVVRHEAADGTGPRRPVAPTAPP